MFYSRRIVRRATRWFLRARNRSWSIGENIASSARPRDPGQHLYEVMDESKWPATQPGGRRPDGETGAGGHRPSRGPHEQPLLLPGSGADCRGHKTDILRLPTSTTAWVPSWICTGSSNRSTISRWATTGRRWRGLLPRRSGLAATQPHLRGTGRVQRAGECATIMADWISEHEQLLSRWTHMLADFKTTSTHEFAKFSVALRELNLLQLNCRTSA